MKRLLSMFLAVAMVISLMPMSFAGETAKTTYVYKLSRDAQGYTSNTAFSPSAFSISNVASGFDKWGYVGACTPSGWSLSASAKSGRAEFTFTGPSGTTEAPTFSEGSLAALCFEIEAEPGTYTPRVAWVENTTSGATSQFYLIEKPDEGVLDTNGTFDGDKFKNYLLSDGFSKNLIGYGDFSLKGGRRLDYTGSALGSSDYANITNRHGKTMRDVNLKSSGNRYYLIAVITGNGSAVATGGNSWGGILLAASLTPADGTNKVGAPSNIYSTSLTVKYPDGKTSLSAGESADLSLSIIGRFEENPTELEIDDSFTITYTSSDKDILTVSDQGIVTGGTKNGTATVTANIVCGDVTKEATCTVEVFNSVNDSGTRVYKFSRDAQGYTSNTAFSPSAFSISNVASGFDKWGYVGACTPSGQSLAATGKSGRSEFTFTGPSGTTEAPTFSEDSLSALCFEIEAKPGTYTPRVAWVENTTSGATAQFYLIEKPDEGVLDTNGTFDGDKFKSYLLSDGFSKNLIGYGDFSLKGGRRLDYTGSALGSSEYGSITNLHGKTMRDVTLEGDHYYLIAVLTGKGAEVATGGNSWGGTLLAFSLTPADGTNKVGDSSNILSAKLSVKYPDGETKLPRNSSADLSLSLLGGFEENPTEIIIDDSFTITYTSSDEDVLTVDADGKVISGNKNGTATITAEISKNGVIKEASCTVEVFTALTEEEEIAAATRVYKFFSSTHKNQVSKAAMTPDGYSIDNMEAGFDAWGYIGAVSTSGRTISAIGHDNRSGFTFTGAADVTDAPVFSENSLTAICFEIETKPGTFTPRVSWVENTTAGTKAEFYLLDKKTSDILDGSGALDSAKLNALLLTAEGKESILGYGDFSIKGGRCLDYTGSSLGSADYIKVTNRHGKTMRDVTLESDRYYLVAVMTGKGSGASAMGNSWNAILLAFSLTPSKGENKVGDPDIMHSAKLSVNYPDGYAKLPRGESTKLSLTLFGGFEENPTEIKLDDTCEITYTSSNNKVLTVSSDGTVTGGEKNGTATVTATVSRNGITVSANCNVKVYSPLAEGEKEEARVHLYKFFSTSHNNQPNKGTITSDGYSITNMAAGYEPWGYVGTCAPAGWTVSAVGNDNRAVFTFTGQSGDTKPPAISDDKLSAVCFEIEVAPGTYTPRVSWVESATNGISTKFYLIDKADADILDGSGALDSAKLKERLLNADAKEKLIGYGDFSLQGGRRLDYTDSSLGSSEYTSVTNLHGKTMRDVTIGEESDRYYLIAVTYGKGSSETITEGNAWRAIFLGFSLTPSNGKSTVGREDVMCKASLSVNYPNDTEKLPRGESTKLSLSILGGFEENPEAIDYNPEDVASIDYKSSDERILLVSPDGTITGGIHNGTATVTAIVTYKGITKETSCDVRVWSPIKFAKVVTTLRDDYIAVGESTDILSTIPKYEDGADADIEDSVITYEIADDDKDIARFDETTGEIVALKEGKATLITTISASGGVTTSENEITVDNSYGVEKVFLYTDESIPVGKTAEFKTSLKLKNGKILRGGEILSLEILKESQSGVAVVSKDKTSLLGAKSGTSEIQAKVKARGNEFTSDTAILTVTDFGKYSGKNFSIDFRKDKYVGDNFTTLDGAKEYTDYRNWVFHELSASGVYDKNLLLREGTFCYVVFDMSNPCPYLAFRVKFPESGKYAVDTYTYDCYRSANTELYVMPASSENLSDIPSKLSRGNDYYVGSLDFYSEEVVDYATARYGFANIPESGEYLVVIKVIPGKAQEIKYFNGDVFYGHYISFTHNSTLDRATLALAEEKETLILGESVGTVFSMFGGSGNEIAANEETLRTLRYASSDENIAIVDESGKITAISEGKAKITASVTLDGITKEASLEIKTEDTSGIAEGGITASAAGSVYVYGETELVVSALMNSGKTVRVPAEFVEWELLPQSDDDVVVISEDDIASGINLGTAHLKAHILPGWKNGAENADIAAITLNVAWDASVELTVFTREDRDNAKRNALKYDWAKTDVNTIKATAEKYVDNAERLYDLIAPEGIPRYYYIGHSYDPGKFFCRYCGKNIGLEYGTYGFQADPIARPWKVQCPDCKRLFPSNDFGSFYKLGLSADKTWWSYTDALQKHHEMFVCDDGENCTHTPPAASAPEPGSAEWMNNDPRNAEWRAYYGYDIEGGFLTNILYKDMDNTLGIKGWGVDDGFGYHQPYIGDENLPGYHVQYSDRNGYAWYEDGTESGPVNYYFIGYYIHEGMWHGGKVTSAIDALTEAFVYTGDAKYGRAGAILLDRIADIYPKFDWYMWSKWRGDEYRGTVVDQIWGTSIATSLAAAYDAFKPIYNDPYVVKFLSENGITYKKDENGTLVVNNPKNSPGAIRKNAEDGILRQIYEYSLYGNLYGNFGRRQAAVATAAVALNKMPETGEMLNWMLLPTTNGYNTGEKRHKISGGDLMRTIIEDVDLDGFGSENSPQYNRTWVSNLDTVAERLSGYELYPSADLYDNPRFIKMAMASHLLTLGGYYTAQTGDHGSTADKKVYLPDGTVLKEMFVKTGDIELAQILYLNNGNTVEGLHGSIFDDNPEYITDKIQEIIDEHGTINLSSELLSGYGFAALRDGEFYNSAVSTGRVNNHRDFAIYFGSTDKHGHSDSLNLYISAFGLNMAPDLGYPEQTGTQPNRVEWVGGTISHNTVVVNESPQSVNTRAGKPHHFDDAGRVKVMDVSSDSYKMTDDYRRTVFMVEATDDISYGVDFFHIKGGNDHMYSFHSQSNELYAIDGLSGLTSYPTYEKDGKLIGTYAGPDVAYGAAPKNSDGSHIYPVGYTWLKNVRTYNTIGEKFSVEFKVKDWNRALAYNRDLRLKLTMVNEDLPEEVSFVTGLPPQTAGNKTIDELEYLLVRNKGRDIDTTFTTVFEPYEAGNEYIASVEKVSMERNSEKPSFAESYGAVKVTLKNGRVDYIMYSTNTDVDYIVDEKINFRGFGGVLSLENNGGKETVVYSYLNDGEVLSLMDSGKTENKSPSAYTGTVVSFTKDLATANSIVYKPDAETDVAAITGKYVYVANDEKTNAVYRIESAEVLDNDDIKLHLGNTTLIRAYRDYNDVTLGYIYNIAEGQTLRIPMTNTYDSSPEFEQIADASASVGSTIVIPLKVSSDKQVKIIGTNLPRGMAIDEEEMVLRWKPTSSHVGKNHVAITANDGTLESTIHFTIMVYGSTTGSGGGGGDAGTTTKPEVKPEESEKEPTTEPENPSGGNVRFTDLGAHDWAADAINALADAGIIKGTSDTTYSPAANITRADFAILLVRAFGLSSDNTENFADVNNSDYFAKELAIARNTGIINGIGDNKFAPRNTITRQDMMVIVYRILTKLGVELEIADVYYDDFADVADYAEDAVKALITSGLVNGKSGRIAPTDYTTRAEVAVLIKRILDYER